MNRARIIFPSSLGSTELIDRVSSRVSDIGFEPLFVPPPKCDGGLYVRQTIIERADILEGALREGGVDVVFCGRGGYGASELLPHLDWGLLMDLQPKWVVGFSDISALHSAFYTRMKWKGIHGPMPATSLWGKDGVQDDLDEMRRVILGEKRSGLISFDSMESLNGVGIGLESEGELFGGCLSVLCSMVGTPYFPESLAGRYLFFEDVGETPGRILRSWNQLIQAGLLKGVLGVVLGSFSHQGEGVRETDVKVEMARRVNIPVWSSQAFGHLSPNQPLVIGATGLLTKEGLTWKL